METDGKPSLMVVYAANDYVRSLSGYEYEDYDSADIEDAYIAGYEAAMSDMRKGVDQ